MIFIVFHFIGLTNCLPVLFSTEEKPKTTTTPFVYATAEHITKPEIPKDRNNIKSGRHRLQPTQNSRGKPYHNPKGINHR